MPRRSHWAVVLAGGEGARLASLVRALFGHALPKQFVTLDGSQSLLESTVDRIEPLGFRRCLVVAAREYAGLARTQLEGHDGVEVVAQPANLGTAPGILLPLAHIQARDPEAVVAVFPSDHHVPTPEPFLEAVEVALAGSEKKTHPLVLLGIAADGPERDYGWILPGPPVGQTSGRPLHLVERFVEKPDVHQARDLLGRGGLWNTFVLVGALAEFWSMVRKRLPACARSFQRLARAVGTPGEESELESLYAELTPANFSRDVLERTSPLAVVKVEGSGWSDLGTPERFLRALGEGASYDRDMAKVS